MPPCFLVVCNNTSTSKLVHDFIAGFSRENEDRSTTLVNGRLELFRNFDEHGNPLSRLRTLLIDSEQLDSGEALDKNFRVAAGDEIERFRRERIQRTGDRKEASIFTAEPAPVKPQKPRETVLVVLVDDGCGDDDDLLRLVVEVKGYRGEDAKDKKSTRHLLGSGRQQPRRLRPQGLRRAVRRLPDGGGLRGRAGGGVPRVARSGRIVTQGQSDLTPGISIETTRYFDEQVRRKRPYIDPVWCVEMIAAPLRHQEQPDGRIRFRGEIVPPGETGPRILRVVTLDDGETIHNAFFDRGFRRDAS